MNRPIKTKRTPTLLLKGQGTVEYAVVFVAFLALVVALGALSNFLTKGAIIDHVLLEASHHVEGAGGVVRDVFIY